MENGLPALMIAAILMLSSVLISRGGLLGADAIGQTLRESESRYGQQNRTGLTVTATSVDAAGANITVTVRNDGSTPVGDWAAMDVLVQYFGESGTRVLYTLPQQWTDALIPLKIEPQPEKTLRVMVGRLEAMTPEVEQELASLITSGAEAEAIVAAAPNNAFGGLGRFGSAGAYHIARKMPTEELRDRANRVGNGLRAAEDEREAQFASR